MFLECCLFKYVFILAFPHSTFFFDFNLFLIHQFVYQAYFVFGVAGFQNYCKLFDAVLQHNRKLPLLKM